MALSVRPQKQHYLNVVIHLALSLVMWPPRSIFGARLRQRRQTALAHLLALAGDSILRCCRRVVVWRLAISFVCGMRPGPLFRHVCPWVAAMCHGWIGKHMWLARDSCPRPGSAQQWRSTPAADSDAANICGLTRVTGWHLGGCCAHRPDLRVGAATRRV